MAIRIELEALALETRYTFKIARGGRKSYRNFVFHLYWEGVEGLGEAAPQEYYGETEETVLSAFQRIKNVLAGEPVEIRRSIQRGRLREVLEGDSSVRAALDMALWDIEGKVQGKPCYELLGCDPARAPLTSFTIGFDEPQVVRKKLDEAEPFHVLKIKMGLPGDMEVIEEIRKHTAKRIRVDANEGWDLDSALKIIPELGRMGVEFVEQPISKHSKSALRELKEKSSLPVILDESVVDTADVDEAARMSHGINVKLMKCGGISTAHEMIRRAESLGLRTMLGCMIETSLGVTAAAHLSPMVDFADLDGNLLLAEDPFVGVAVEDGRLVLPTGPGLGVTRRR